MRSIDRLLFLGSRAEQHWKRYIVDAFLAGISPFLVTMCIYVFRLYPKIPNISLLYIVLVLVLASTRGLYAAIVASVVAFLSFDYYQVQPLYTFTVGSFEEWLALFVFLVASIITGQLASALRQRAEEAMQREQETRTLYELVNATTSEENLERQLSIVTQAIVKVFASAGVHCCAILMPDDTGDLVLWANTCKSGKPLPLTTDEEATALSAMGQGKMVDLYYDAVMPQSDRDWSHRIRRVLMAERAGAFYVRMIPLMVGQRSVGVVRLLVEKHVQQLVIDRSQETERNGFHSQAAFFWTFLDQAAAIIERARLHRESLQVELLQRTDALRSALLSSVSHDLRTPLASIKAAASSLLQEDIQWDEEARNSFLQAIEGEADRLNRLVGNLLDMSRIEGGAVKPEKEWYPIDELIHDVLGHMHLFLQGREIRVTIPDDLPPVELDYLQMDQVLTNLLENAVRYTPATSPIEVAAERVDDQIMVSIGDYGPGIPVEDVERIFDKFYRVLNTRQEGKSVMGSGLGLAVCRGLVEAHGGRIWAENREGEKGAIFHFTLPLGKANG
jgi:two-component system sensor histidine kinase KdpD